VKTIHSHYSYTTEVNRSKFIAHLVPIEAYKAKQKTLKEQNPKANHIVYALRYLNKYEQMVENFSDDNEPKGCAGMPALHVLRGEEMVNCAILIVRYFGGIKLGTGGMARAYAIAVKRVLDEATIVTYEKMVSYTFETSYALIEKTLYQLKKNNIKEYEREFSTHHVQWRVRGGVEDIKKFKGFF